MQYKLGVVSEMSTSTSTLALQKAIITSPYTTLRDAILGQSDFVKKQSDIVQFANKFTREAMPDTFSLIYNEKESIYWRYCIQTNTKLLPAFLYVASSTYINTPDDYAKAETKLNERSERAESSIGAPGSATTLGKLVTALQSPGEPRILFHGLCGSIDGDASTRETATTIVTKRLFELHPKAVIINTHQEFTAFLHKLGTAIYNLAHQVTTVASRKNIAKHIKSLVPAGGAGAGLAKGGRGRRTQRKRRQ